MIIALGMVLLAAVATASAELSSLLSMDASQVLSGEVWRLISGHVTHLTWRHYLWDAPVFVLLFTVYERKDGAMPATMLALCSSVAVSLTVVMAGAHQLYGGLSGLSSAALSAILTSLIVQRQQRLVACGIGLAFGAYLLFSDGGISGVRIAGEAHAAGAVTGMIFAVTLHCLRYQRSRTVEPLLENGLKS